MFHVKHFQTHEANVQNTIIEIIIIYALRNNRGD